MNPANQKRARVTIAYQAQYPDPIRVAEGEKLRVGHDDPAFPGWKWCTAGDGRSGWVPVELLSGPGPDATIIHDYSAQELNASTDEVVVVEDARHAWLLARNKKGQRGWIPASHVVLL